MIDAPDPAPPARERPFVVFLATTVVLLAALLVVTAVRRVDGSGDAGEPSGDAPGRLAERPEQAEGPLARFERRIEAEFGEYTPAERTTIELFRDATPSVVHVTSRARDTEDPLDTTATEYVQGTGSGVVWDLEGHIVTNHHVVEDSSSALVTLFDGSRWEAKLIGTDRRTDLAVLRIDAPRELLRPVRVGSSEGLAVGQAVLAIGNPYGLDHSLSTGVVSGLNRRVMGPSGNVLTGVVQTDAAIHPGSSGGPLLDSAGRMIGINTAVHGEADRKVGVGFALPIERVQELVPAILRDGFQWYPALGIVAQRGVLTEWILARMVEETDAWDALGDPHGVAVLEVDADRPAARAGVRGIMSVRRADGSSALAIGDVVVGVDGQPVRTRDDLDELLWERRGADRIALDLVSREGLRTVVLELEPR